MGYEVFADAALASGVDGVLTVDCHRGSDEVAALYQRRAGDVIFLAVATTTLQAGLQRSAHARASLLCFAQGCDRGSSVLNVT